MWVPHHSYRCCIKALKFLHFSPFIFMRGKDAWKPFIPFYVFFFKYTGFTSKCCFFFSASENNNILKIWDHVFQNNKVIKPFPQAIQIKLRMKHLKQTLLNMFKEKIAFQACKSVLCALWCFIKRSSRAKINNCRNLKNKERWDLKLRVFLFCFFCFFFPNRLPCRFLETWVLCLRYLYLHSWW